MTTSSPTPPRRRSISASEAGDSQKDVAAATPQLTPRFQFGSSTAGETPMTPVLIQQLTDARTQGVLMGKLIRKIREEATGAVDTSDLEDCCPRWRATYDLLLAQLFEMESRTANYVRAIDSVGELKKTTNQVLLGKPMLTRVSTPAQQEAVERFAKADEDYAGTPWGYRAELERKAMHTIDSHQYRASPPISCWLVERTFLERPTSARRSSRTLRAAKQTSTGW